MTTYPEQYMEVTNLRILEVFQFTSNTLIYLSKILQFFQQKSPLPCNSAFINGGQSRILNHKGKSSYNNGSWMSNFCLMQATALVSNNLDPFFNPTYANFNKHTANSSSMASLKATSCMAAALAAASASVNIFRKGLFPLAKSPWLNEEREANALNQSGCGCFWACLCPQYVCVCAQVHALQDLTNRCQFLGLLCADCCILCSFSPAES